MDTLKTEEEQAEEVKKWLRENGGSLATGILLGLAVLFGGKAWVEYGKRQSESASNLYAQISAAVAGHDEAAATSMYESMIKDFSGSTYAVLSAMQIARLQLEGGNAEAARAQLQWAHDHAETPELQQVTRLRLARLLVDAGEYDRAQQLISGVQEGEFAALYAELRGDLARARGDFEAAHAAYEKALTLMPADAPGRALVEAKRDDSVRGGAETS